MLFLTFHFPYPINLRNNFLQVETKSSFLLEVPVDIKNTPLASEEHTSSKMQSKW